MTDRTAELAVCDSTGMQERNVLRYRIMAYSRKINGAWIRLDRTAAFYSKYYELFSLVSSDLIGLPFE